jgi:mono/diheme cytochrome c family protein
MVGMMQSAVVLMAVAAVFVAATAMGDPAGSEPPPSRAQFERGEQLFESICAHCHGPHMVNPGTVSFDLRKFPHDDRGRFFNSVRNGKNYMPPWKDILKPDEIEAIWAYVRSGGQEP